MVNQKQKDEREYLGRYFTEQEAREMIREYRREEKRNSQPKIESEGAKMNCIHCGSENVEYSNYKWFCNNCDEQWDRWGQDTK